jgi:purine-binding chemotaxis protein CheW
VGVQEGLATALFLLCRFRAQLCALPLDHVVETMRPLVIEPLAGMPPFVCGVSVVRGRPTPVVDVGTLLGAGGASAHIRFVTVNTGERHVVLAVEAVLGIREFGSTDLYELPPLLRDASVDMVSAVGGLDTEFLLVLQAARIVPEAVWQTLKTSGAP